MLRLGRDGLLVVICAALAGCAPHNASPRDRALSSTAEVARLDFGYKKLDHRASFNSKVKGIYLSQSTLENRDYLQYLISQSQQAGINTFVIDLHAVTNAYERNILLIKNSGIRYVARIKVFPAGVSAENIKSEAYWLNRYRMVEAALNLGAEEIQLDYQYATSNLVTLHSEDVQQLIGWFKQKIGDQANLQVDVFSESRSQFDFYHEHAKRPYEVVYSALTNIKNRSADKDFAAYPYIELTNYRHTFSDEQLQNYIHNQVAAVEAAHADGWYAWSSSNKYDSLFAILKDNL